MNSEIIFGNPFKTLDIILLVSPTILIEAKIFNGICSNKVSIEILKLLYNSTTNLKFSFFWIKYKNVLKGTSINL